MKKFLKNTFKRGLDGFLSILLIFALLNGVKFGYANIINQNSTKNISASLIASNEINLKNPNIIDNLNKKESEKIDDIRIQFKQNINDEKKKQILEKLEIIKQKEKTINEKILQNHFSKKQPEEKNNLNLQGIGMDIHIPSMADLREINAKIEEEFNKLIDENFTEEQKEYVSMIGPNYFYTLLSSQSTFAPNDTLINNQWYIKHVTGRSDFQIPNSNTPQVVVAVVDSGINTQHEDLKDILWKSGICLDHINRTISGGCLNGGWDYADSSNNPDNRTKDNISHGTQVAGVAGANTNNNKGIASFSNNKAKIMSIRTFKYYVVEGKLAFTTTTENIANGIRFATNNGAKIINLSLGGPLYDSAIYNAIAYAKQKDVLVIAASGNGDNLGNGQNIDTNPTYPAAYNLDNIIAVAALGKDNKLATFSNYGTKVHIAAPGVDILSTINDGGYIGAHGTSFAAPLVASVAVQLYQTGDTYLMLKNKILNSAGTFTPTTGKSIGISPDQNKSLKISSTSQSDPIQNLTEITTNYLTKDHYNTVVRKVNEIIDRLDVMGIQSLSVFNANNQCYWKTIQTNESITCNNNEYAIGLCLTNKSLGCLDGIPTGEESKLNTAGAIQCCLSN